MNANYWEDKIDWLKSIRTGWFNEDYIEFLVEKVCYLSPLSSSTVDFENEKMAESLFTIEANTFKIESDKVIEIKTPNYMREEISARVSLCVMFVLLLAMKLSGNIPSIQKMEIKLIGGCMFPRRRGNEKHI